LLPGCLSKDVTGTSRNFHSPLFVYVILHRVSVQRRDRLTVIIFSCDFLRSHSVSVQRRDRSLFFLLHCYFKVPFLFTWSLRFNPSSLPLFRTSFALTQCVCPKTWQVAVLFTALLYQGPPFTWLFLFFLTLLPPFRTSYRYIFTVCLSKDVAGTLLFILILLDPSDYLHFLLFAQCVCPKTWQVLCFSLLTFARPFLSSVALFWLHSVSVQRRDRCSATYPTLPLSWVLEDTFPPPF